MQSSCTAATCSARPLPGPGITHDMWRQQYLIWDLMSSTIITNLFDQQTTKSLQYNNPSKSRKNRRKLTFCSITRLSTGAAPDTRQTKLIIRYISSPPSRDAAGPAPHSFFSSVPTSLATPRPRSPTDSGPGPTRHRHAPAAWTAPLFIPVSSREQPAVTHI